MTRKFSPSATLSLGLLGFLLGDNTSVGQSHVHTISPIPNRLVSLARSRGKALLFVLAVSLPLLSPPVTSRAETSRKVVIFSSEDPNLPGITILNQTIRSTIKNGEVRHWGIDESKFAVGSIVSFTEPTFWALYKWRIIGVISLCILEAFLIVWLLITRARQRQAEEASKTTEERYRNVIETQTELICRYLPDSTLTFVNDAYCRYFGKTRAELIGTKFVELIPEPAREAALSHVTSLIENPRDETYEHEVVLPDGSMGWQQWMDHVVNAANGHRLELQGIGRDITEKRRAEEELRQSETRFRDMADACPVLIWIADTEMLCTYFNQKCLDFTGCTMEQLLGEGWLNIVHEEDKQRCVDAYTAGYERKQPFVMEFRIRTANGEFRWLYDTGAPRFASNGEFLGYIGSSVDITDRRRAEEELRVSEARFRTMADSAPVLIWMSDPDMLCNYINQGWLDFTGRTVEQELGHGWTGGIHKEDYARCLDTYCSAVDLRQPFKLEYRLRRADGVFRWIYDSGTPRFTSAGEFLGYIGSCIDIGDRKEAEEGLRQAHEEVNKLKNQLEAENIYLQEEIKLAHNVDEIVGQSNGIKYVLFKIEQVAETDTTVLILGETGTGKELVARAIHNQSHRKDRPLVKVNCAALSASLIESELFGHEKGAFTGASARKIGRFELADGATIFLDEIGELPLELQPKLLRVIQEGEFERLGSSKTTKVDVRIIAATNRNMKTEVEKGAFREDLWYRLNVFPITVPPLRQRKDDIPPMVEHFVATLSKKVGKTMTCVSSVTLKKLQDYAWPGNVRELANVIERAVVTAQGQVLHIAEQFEQIEPAELSNSARTLEDIEKEYITHILDQTAWRIEGPNGAARILGLNPSTLRTRMAKLGIQKNIRSFAGSAGGGY